MPLKGVDHIVDAMGNTTQFEYGTNSGGNAFDSSSFKPTQTTDPRGYITKVVYDALYRTTEKSIAYDSAGHTSSTFTQYDNVGDPVLVIDPLNNQTKTCFDALNRPIKTIYADDTTSLMAYTSTGFKWQVTDENGNVTQTQYDTAGRPVDNRCGGQRWPWQPGFTHHADVLRCRRQRSRNHKSAGQQMGLRLRRA